MNLSFGSLSGNKTAPVARKNSIDAEPVEEISPSKGSSGFSSKLGDYGRSISGMSKKVTSVASALVMSDEKEKEKTPNKPNLERQKQVEQLVENFRSEDNSFQFLSLISFSSLLSSPPSLILISFFAWNMDELDCSVLKLILALLLHFLPPPWHH
jgi:hypothetical protein